MESTDRDILSYDLFQGDRDSDVTIFSNRMLVTRKQHRCVNCQQDIPASTRVRAQTERDNDDRVVMTFYVCVLCCAAIANRFVDDGDAIEDRVAIGMGRLL